MKLKFMFGFIPVIFIFVKNEIMAKCAISNYGIFVIMNKDCENKDMFTSYMIEYNKQMICSLFTRNIEARSNPTYLLLKELEAYLPYVKASGYSIGTMSKVFGVINDEPKIFIHGNALRSTVTKFYFRKKKEQ